MSAQGRASAGGLHQSTVGREGLLLLGSLSGEWGGGSHGIAGNSNAETSTAFLQQLRENHPGPLVVIWDNGPAHRGEAIRSYLATPDLHLRLVALPAYSPDFNADEAVLSRIRWAQGSGHGQRMPGLFPPQVPGVGDFPVLRRASARTA